MSQSQASSSSSSSAAPPAQQASLLPLSLRIIERRPLRLYHASSPFTPQDSCGRVLDVVTSPHPSGCWVSFGDTFPDPYADLRPPPSGPRNSHLYAPPSVPGATLHGVEPAWHDPARPWFAYRPLPVPRTWTSWIYDPRVSSAWVTGSPEVSRIEAQRLRDVARDSEEAQLVGSALAQHLGVAHAPSDVPKWTQWPSLRSADEHRLTLSLIRRRILEWRGFVAWMLAHVGEHWRMLPVPGSWVSTVESWGLAELEPVGVIVDLAVPEGDLPHFGDLLRHGVPIRYLWLHDYAGPSFPHLAALSPSRLHALDWQDRLSRRTSARKADKRRAKQDSTAAWHSWNNQPPVPQPPASASTATPTVTSVSALFASAPLPGAPSLRSRLAPVHPVDPPSLRTSHRAGPVHVPAIPPSAARGTLYFDFRGMIRVALRRREHPDEAIGDLLRWLLGRGVAFVWRVPVPPVVASVVFPSDAPPSAVPPTSVAAYEASVRAVLLRPHARHWLQRGGLAWRLALHYGPPDILDRVVAGPSPRTTALGLGTSRDVPVLSIGDVTSPAEDAALVGAGVSTSVWPSLLLWEDSVMWVGEWSAPAEYWFLRRLADLAAGRDVFLTDRQWRRQLHRVLQARDRTDGAEHGSVRRASELVAAYADAASVAMLSFSPT